MYTLSQLEQAYQQGREDMREEAEQAVHEIPRNGAWVTKVEAIAAIGGIK
jgi:hypothetical protein